MIRSFPLAQGRTLIRVRPWAIFFAAVWAGGCLASMALAQQPAPSAAPPITHPPTPAVSTPSKRPVAKRPENLTGYKLKIDVAGERTIRAQLRLAGYTESSLIDAVIAFVRQREAARVVLQKTADQLAVAVATPNYDRQKFSDLYDSFAAQLDEESERCERAEKELDTQIHWSTDKRLTAALLLAGVIGDATGFLITPDADESTVENVTGAEANAAQ